MKEVLVSRRWKPLICGTLLVLVGILMFARPNATITPSSVHAQDQENRIFLPLLMNGGTSQALPELVLAQSPSIHPEGVEWDGANQRFLVGSLTRGSVFAVADDGTVTPFATSDNLSMGSVGIHIDKTTNRLLVTHSNPVVLGNQDVAGVA